MKTSRKNQTDKIWSLIDLEKKKDRLVKWICQIAWGLTLLVGVFLLVFAIRDFKLALNLYHVGQIPYKSVINTVELPLLVIGALCLLIAVLATIGVFLRIRTTSLLDIQQRLAALERMISEEK